VLLLSQDKLPFNLSKWSVKVINDCSFRVSTVSWTWHICTTKASYTHTDACTWYSRAIYTAYN